MKFNTADLYVSYIRYLLAGIGSFFSIVSCLGLTIAYMMYKELRNGVCKYFIECR